MPGRKLPRTVAEFLGLRRNLVILLIAIFCIGAGEELWMRFLPKYLKEVGATIFVIGLFDGLRYLCSARSTPTPAESWWIAGVIGALFLSSTPFPSSGMPSFCLFPIGAPSSAGCFCFSPGPVFLYRPLSRSSLKRCRPIDMPWALAFNPLSNGFLS